MSMCKLHTVAKARKAQGPCTRCRKPIEVGDKYFWWAGRYTPKYVRCHQHPPAAHERETNPIKASYMQAEDAVGWAQSAEEVSQASSDLQTAIDYATEVQEALDERVSSWAGTNLEYTQQYESCCQTASDMGDWVGQAEGILQDLAGIDDSIDDALEPEDKELRQGEIDNELAEVLSQIEELPELDLGA